MADIQATPSSPLPATQPETQSQSQESPSPSSTNQPQQSPESKGDQNKSKKSNGKDGNKSNERGNPNQGGYVNPSRHLSTGGPQRTKLTPEELEAKMQKAKEANAALVKRQEEIDKDKAAFNELTAQDRKAREEASKKKIAEKKAQLALEEERAKNRERKLEKQEGRMWDAEKKDEELWKNHKPYRYEDQNSRGGYGNGTSSSRSRGGSRGGGNAPTSSRGGGGGGVGKAAGRELIDTNSKDDFPELGNGNGKIPTGPKNPGSKQIPNQKKEKEQEKGKVENVVEEKSKS